MTARRFDTPSLIRKIHIQLGLFLLVLTWIFALSGLMLNHPRWEISQFWNRRQVETTTQPLVGLSADSVEGKRTGEGVRLVLEAVGIEGEPESVRWDGGTGLPTISVVRPGTISEIAVRPGWSEAEVKRTSTDGAGVLHMLHNFNGVSTEDSSRHRDWFWTTVWIAAMDLLACALILWVLTGYYLWLQVKSRRLAGVICASAGMGLVLFFLVGPAFLP